MSRKWAPEPRPWRGLAMLVCAARGIPARLKVPWFYGLR